MPAARALPRPDRPWHCRHKTRTRRRLRFALPRTLPAPACRTPFRGRRGRPRQTVPKIPAAPRPSAHHKTRLRPGYSRGILCRPRLIPQASWRKPAALCPSHCHSGANRRWPACTPLPPRRAPQSARFAHPPAATGSQSSPRAAPPRPADRIGSAFPNRPERHRLLPTLPQGNRLRAA